VKAELSMERELSPEELVEIDLHEIRKQLKKVGLQTLKSLMFFTSASYGIASLACLYQLHEPSPALLDILLSISNYGHGRYCHAMIYRILDEVEEKSRFEATIRSKSQENNKLKFMQFVLHEVRVPLNSIVLGLDLLGIEEGLTEDIQDTVDMMKQSASFMVATLNDVLSWQKVEQGVVDLDLAPLSPDRLVQSVLASFR
jgi:signal transduction histidine kinase